MTRASNVTNMLWAGTRGRAHPVTCRSNRWPPIVHDVGHGAVGLDPVSGFGQLPKDERGDDQHQRDPERPGDDQARRWCATRGGVVGRGGGGGPASQARARWPWPSCDAGQAGLVCDLLERAEAVGAERRQHRPPCSRRRPTRPILSRAWVAVPHAETECTSESGTSAMVWLMLAWRGGPADASALIAAISPGSAPAELGDVRLLGHVLREERPAVVDRALPGLRRRPTRRSAAAPRSRRWNVPRGGALLEPPPPPPVVGRRDQEVEQHAVGDLARQLHHPEADGADVDRAPGRRGRRRPVGPSKRMSSTCDELTLVGDRSAGEQLSRRR